MGIDSSEAAIQVRLFAMAARRSGDGSLNAQADTPLNELGIDSLGMAELMFELDDEFGIEISDEHLRELKQVKDLVALIQKLLADKAPDK